MRIGYIISINATRYKYAETNLLNAGFLPESAELVSTHDKRVEAIVKTFGFKEDIQYGNMSTRNRPVAITLSHVINWKGLHNWTYIFEDDVFFNFKKDVVQYTLDIVENCTNTVHSPIIYLQTAPRKHPMFSGSKIHTQWIYNKYMVEVYKCATPRQLGGTQAYGISKYYSPHIWERVMKETRKDASLSHGRLRFNIDDRLKHYFGKLRRTKQWKYENWPVCVSINSTDIALQTDDSNAGHATKNWFAW
jgi:hypothetical protein